MDANDWLNDLPAAPVNVGGRPVKGKRPANRQYKIACDECGLILYATSYRKLQGAGLPSCGCGGAFVVPNLRDRAVIEWDTLERELTAQGADAYEAAMRSLGARDLQPRAAKRGDRAGVRKTCEASGCHKFTSGRYCPEHHDERPSMGAAFKR